MANLFRAHGRVAAALREVDTWDADGDGKATLISVAHHVRVFQPASSSPLDTFVAGVTDDFFNESVPRALVTGHIKLWAPGAVDIDEWTPGLAGSVDWLGINYYTRDVVRADLGDPALSKSYVHPGRPTNSLGWDLYPDGLALFLTRFQSYGVPMVITENGIADAEGTERPKFLAQHVAAIEQAILQGANVRGYVHWALLDNFEWAEGYTPRFGLFHVDYANGRARTPTPAVETFRTIQSHIPR
jgi:beta-glucosidase